MTAADHGPCWRSVFLSDIHLGSRGCRAALLAGFLEHMRAEQLFLLGDIVDLESLRRECYWPDTHEQIYQSFLHLAASGTRVLYVPGNHDRGIRRFCGGSLGGIEIHRSLIHETAAGQRLLLTHGDEFDVRRHYSPPLARAAAILYGYALRLNALVHAGRDWTGRPYWSLLTSLKWRVQAVRTAVARFEDHAARAAADAGLDGIICGHIHRPIVRDVHGVRYVNTGDWVEHCTVLGEHADGRLELLDCTARTAIPSVLTAGHPIPAAA
jgi:UDP-2,3-diacylglucosamine pyrophosphatase LpxH